jgi:hypothetical protein
MINPAVPLSDGVSLSDAPEASHDLLPSSAQPSFFLPLLVAASKRSKPAMARQNAGKAASPQRIRNPLFQRVAGTAIHAGAQIGSRAIQRREAGTGPAMFDDADEVPWLNAEDEGTH